MTGDALFPDNADGVVATGFIAAGPWDYVGHVELSEKKTDGVIALYNDRDDMLMNTMSTFVSLTVHCARCHDHKFDPNPQKDYYALQAVFAGVERGDRPFDPPETAARRVALSRRQKDLEARRAELPKTVERLTSPDLAEIDGFLKKLHRDLAALPRSAGTRPSPTNGYHSSIMPTPTPASGSRSTSAPRCRSTSSA